MCFRVYSAIDICHVNEQLEFAESQKEINQHKKHLKEDLIGQESGKARLFL